MKFPCEARGDKFDKEKAKQLINQVGLGNYDLDAEIEHMSGGERQRITIARQLMYEPEVLLLDESTSALDTKNKENIEKIIFEFAKRDSDSLDYYSDDQSMRHFQRRITITDGKISNDEELSGHE